MDEGPQKYTVNQICTSCGNPAYPHPYRHPIQLVAQVPRVDDGVSVMPLAAVIQLAVTVAGTRYETVSRGSVANGNDLAIALARAAVEVASQLFPTLEWKPTEGISGK